MTTATFVWLLAIGVTATTLASWAVHLFALLIGPWRPSGRAFLELAVLSAMNAGFIWLAFVAS